MADWKIIGKSKKGLACYDVQQSGLTGYLNLSTEGNGTYHLDAHVRHPKDAGHEHIQFGHVQEEHVGSVIEEVCADPDKGWFLDSDEREPEEKAPWLFS